MATCPFKTPRCGLSTPCPRCRAAASRRSATLPRYSARGGRK